MYETENVSQYFTRRTQIAVKATNMYDCEICGAVVAAVKFEKHIEWHNEIIASRYQGGRLR